MSDGPGAERQLFWLALPACASVMLLATTNTLTQDVAAVPFLWVLPLALYLLTFIVAFAGKGERPYRRAVLGPMLAVAAAGVCWVLFQDSAATLPLRVGVLAAALFVCGVACHGELAALRPPPRHLTRYYLTISAGGVLGGLLVAVVAPLVLVRYVELHIGLWACCGLALLVRWRGGGLSRPAAFLSVVGLVVLGFALWTVATRLPPDSVAVHRSRDFYGVLSVYESRPADPPQAALTLFHGSIIHGRQFTRPDRRGLPATYYGDESGAGMALKELTAAGAPGRRVGVVGLGTGTLAAYGRVGDVFRFYELSPRVAELARAPFTFLADSPADSEIVVGDARVSMEREATSGSRNFDLLVLDAFSGDAIPVHLLTAEAFALYRRHLGAGGMIAVHISNNHLDLEPVLARQAAHAGWSALLVHSPEGTGRSGTLPADWVLLAPDAARLDPFRGGGARGVRDDPRVRLWTDEYASLLRVLR